VGGDCLRMQRGREGDDARRWCFAALRAGSGERWSLGWAYCGLECCKLSTCFAVRIHLQVTPLLTCRSPLLSYTGGLISQCMKYKHSPHDLQSRNRIRAWRSILKLLGKHSSHYCPHPNAAAVASFASCLSISLPYQSVLYEHTPLIFSHSCI
jgi:hypothetical protein